jgi:hypothetical protein
MFRRPVVYISHHILGVKRFFVLFVFSWPDVHPEFFIGLGGRGVTGGWLLTMASPNWTCFRLYR